MVKSGIFVRVKQLTSAKSHPGSDMVVLCPDSGSIDSASCASSVSCTDVSQLVASGVSGHPSQY